MTPPLRAPWPWYGSKLKAAPLIESLMDEVKNLVIPFAGSLGELLGRSEPADVETINDLDGFVVNAWRGLQYSPEKMARLCDHPVHEITMHGAHEMLIAYGDSGRVRRRAVTVGPVARTTKRALKSGRRPISLPALLRTDPTAHSVELAAWWVWGASCWLGSGWCREPSEKNPRLGGQGSRPHQGLGVARPWVARPQLSPGGSGLVSRQLPMLSGSYTGHPAHGQGVHASHQREALLEYFSALSARLRFVRITCGDWRRILTEAVTTSHGVTGVFLDPPYRHEGRSTRLYRKDDPELSALARAWALEHGSDPMFRIVIAGKGDEHDELLAHGWTKHVWRDGETLWASPYCCSPANDEPPAQGDLFKRAA